MADGREPKDYPLYKIIQITLLITDFRFAFPQKHIQVSSFPTDLRDNLRCTENASNGGIHIYGKSTEKVYRDEKKKKKLPNYFSL